MSVVIDLLVADASVSDLVGRLQRGERVVATGGHGSSGSFLAGRIAREHPVLLLVAHLDDADEAVDELGAHGVAAARLPAMEVLPGETNVNLELLAERLLLVRAVAAGDAPPVVVAPIAALMQEVPTQERLPSMLRVVRVGDTVDPGEWAEWLVGCGYRRVETVEGAGEFAVRGDIIDVFPPGGEPMRLDLFGDSVERINAVDLGTMGSDRRLDEAIVVGATTDELHREEGSMPFLDSFAVAPIVVLLDVAELTEQGRAYHERVVDARGIAPPESVFAGAESGSHALLEVTRAGAPDAIDLPSGPIPSFAETAPAAVGELADLTRERRVTVFALNEGEAQRARELIDEHGGGVTIDVNAAYVHRGFTFAGAAFVPYHELLNRYQTRRRAARLGGGRSLDAFVDVQAGDFVVHRDHGIAQFHGLRTLDDAPDAEEFLVLEFAKGARLNVPASKIDLVQKYIGAFHGKPELSTFGGKRWKGQKEKVADAVRDLAGEMLRLQAARAAQGGIRFPADTAWQREFEAEFPYEETDDQVSAIAAVKTDMAGPRPMDRLVCGDVGFGKTEVAIRAAFKAVEFGKQVAILVPTTVLAEQHERTFRQRFADYPFRIESISRFRTGKHAKGILEELAQGKVDVIIGTHRLLSKDVHFADLGLVVIDEEQRFGVEHKHKLLSFRATADVLTLSATPIPRTLHMALLGLRDISSLTTAPLDRRAIVTDVIPHDRGRIERAIRRELAREGQVFYLHNRVYDIESATDDVRRLVPEARVIYGHGQMPARQLEKVMLSFMRGEADVLVSTTIIESGIDIPNANTMIIADSHRFGLSELHQLRGRVGRYKHRAYCYLLLPGDRTVPELAMRRLRALESFSMLGAGFRIALRDLELRGAGNLLGSEQSGHIAAVGYEMYCQLLEQAVADLRNESKPRAVDAMVDLGAPGSLPKGYIPSDGRRMDAYRRISRADDEAQLDQVRRDLESAYGPIPARGELLFGLAEVRIAAAGLGIRSITRKDPDIIFQARDPVRLEQAMQRAKGTKRVVGDVNPDGTVSVYYRPPPSYLDATSLVNILRKRLGAPSASSRQAAASP